MNNTPAAPGGAVIKGRALPPLNLVVVGASGDLAARKIYPALFFLYCQDLLPRDFRIFGFARTRFTDGAFREHITRHLTCRYTPGAASCAARMDEFLSRCHYGDGLYDDPQAFRRLAARFPVPTDGAVVNTAYYLAVPPAVFLDVARALKAAQLCGRERPSGWTRMVIEKPFGRDRQSSDELTRGLAEVFEEDQIYRIDHYLGKEVVQNLMVLRFANLVFEPVWNHRYIERVWIEWREDLGLEGRAGYFDRTGIIRDVMQNHLLQILSLLAMERPASTAADAVRDEKVRVLRAVAPPDMGQFVLGQYGPSEGADGRHAAYRDEPGVESGSKTPTFAACVLTVSNERWRGVPFVLRAGKGLDVRESEVRVQFREVEDSPFRTGQRHLPQNELVIRIQPDEGIYLGIVSKQPGLDMVLDRTDLNLRYQASFARQIPDAYECLLLDVIEGDKGLFLRSDELEAAWNIFTPALIEMETRGLQPLPYPFGSPGPSIHAIL